MSKSWDAHDVEFAHTYLRNLIDRDQPDAVYGIVNSVAASGASRRIDFYVPTINDGRPSIERISHLVAKILDRDISDRGVLIKGGGMEMIYDTVDSLSIALYGKSNKIKTRQL